MITFACVKPSSASAALARLTLFCSVLNGLSFSASGHSRSMSSCAETPRFLFRIRYAVSVHSLLERPVRLTACGTSIPSCFKVNLPNMVTSIFGTTCIVSPFCASHGSPVVSISFAVRLMNGSSPSFRNNGSKYHPGYCEKIIFRTCSFHKV